MGKYDSKQQTRSPETEALETVTMMATEAIMRNDTQRLQEAKARLQTA